VSKIAKFSLVAAALTFGSLCATSAFSQHTRKVWTVGILWHAANLEEEMVMFRPFSEGMRELGYVEGRNVVYHHTFVDENYDRFQARARELVNRKVDVILASVPAAASAARGVTTTTPIVFAASGDPVKGGLVQSLPRPGGSLTGLSLFYPELTAKHMEILRELVPSLSRVAILSNPNNDDAAVAQAEAEKAAAQLKLHVVVAKAKSPQEFPATFDAISAANVDGMIVLGDAMLRVNRKPIVDFAAASRLPTVYAPRDFVESGGLIAYGVSIPNNFRRSATFIDKILKGAKPSDLPVEQPTRLSLIINLKAAKALNLTIPPSLVTRADELIE
jgi:putative ABC transport system substrate-binding protein